MRSVSRRVLLYWLLLLVPTLAVGAAALWLLQREETRMDERVRAADATRRAAMEARTRLIAENIEVIVADVQSGLMSTLNEAPDTSPASFLAEWKRANPLVRDVFQASGAGRLMWGQASDATLAWLATAPWRQTALAQSSASPASADELARANNFLFDSDDARVSQESAAKDRAIVAGNVAQLNTARFELQEVSKVQSRTDYKISAAAKKTLDDVSSTALESSDKDMAGAAVADAYARASSPATESSVPVARARQPEQSGWTPWSDASGKPHLHGWRLCENGTVLIVEINIDGIVSRLRDVLPASVEAGDFFSIGKKGQRPMHAVGGSINSISGVPHVLNIPIAMLPGWNVHGSTARNNNEASPLFYSRSSLFLIGTLLVAILVIAILAGGSLLMRQARLSAAESAQKTSFVANVSHEFKTPLTTIRLYSELLEQGRIKDESKRAESLQTISRETQRLARLVGNVLDFSRLEQGRKKFELAEYDLRAEIARILDRHAPRMAEAGLKLDFVGPPANAACVVKTDLDAVEQIVINLLDNACKYAAGGGEVTVKVEAEAPVALRKSASPNQAAQRSASTFSIMVADRGPGIPAAHREKIFEKFHRVDDTLTAAQGGAGLGLSIARQLARGLGGDLTYSPRAGGGSEFILTLRTGNSINHAGWKPALQKT